MPGFNRALQVLLVHHGRFLDDRPAPLVMIKRTVRAFLSAGGRLLIAPDNARRQGVPFEILPDMSRYLHDVWSDEDQRATDAMCRLARRWRARAGIERIIRALGAGVDGWTILKGMGS